MSISRRAQRIRAKRLKERDRKKEKDGVTTKENLYAEAIKLFEWVLDLFENPTPYNTKDKVLFIKTHGNCISLLCNYREKKIEDLRFDTEVVQLLVKLFKSEEGYYAGYFPRSSLNPCPAVIIEIK